MSPVKGLLVIIVSFLWLLPSVGKAATIAVDCSLPGTPLQDAIDIAASGDTLNVSGTCNENVSISEEKEIITLDGGGGPLGVPGGAIIDGPILAATVSVRGRGVTIKGFTITGGSNGIQIRDDATALIDSNVIFNTGRRGILLNRHSFARIVNNLIENNPEGGIIVTETSSARIGIVSTRDTIASPNTIQNNGLAGIFDGIRVQRSSHARIVGNDISGNTGDGIEVRKVSHAGISDNDISDNGGDGIKVRENSGVNLGTNTGSGIFNLPNDSTVLNGGFGIRCLSNSYADGRLGTLDGTSGAESFSGSQGPCSNSLIP